MIELFRERLYDIFKEHTSFWTTLEDFIQHRKEIKAPLTKVAVSRLANKFNEYHPNVCTAAMDRAIINGWRGVFPESEIEYGKPTDEPDNPMELLDLLHKRYGSFKMPGFTSSGKNPLNAFYTDMVECVSDGVVDDSEVNITGHLFTLYANLVTNESLKPSFSYKLILQKYFDWIVVNTWINASAKKVFDVDGKFFRRFIKWYSIKYNGNVDILTGEYIKNV